MYMNESLLTNEHKQIEQNSNQSAIKKIAVGALMIAAVSVGTYALMPSDKTKIVDTEETINAIEIDSA